MIYLFYIFLICIGCYALYREKDLVKLENTIYRYIKGFLKACIYTLSDKVVKK